MKKTYESALELLTSQGKFCINLGLERIEAILRLLGNPQDELKCFHVAGTNGKGSVCATLSSILKIAGYRVGLFTSPHIFEYTERIKINDEEITREDFVNYVFEIQNLADENEIFLTEFEILTAVMFKYFKDKKVDCVILETGLGGTYDATNIIKRPICSIITSISLDHTDRLGETIEEIAKEKAGIIKPDCPVVISEENAGYRVVKSVAGDRLIKATRYSLPNIKLKGSHQLENASLTLSALNLFIPNIKMNTVLQGLMNVVHPCRFEYYADKNLIVDGAHNVDGIRVLRENLERFYPKQGYRFIFGCLMTKDYKAMMSELFKSEDEIYFNSGFAANACSVEELKAACKFKSREFSSLDELPKDDKLNVLCGSLYMISKVLTSIDVCHEKRA